VPQRRIARKALAKAPCAGRGKGWRVCGGRMYREFPLRRNP
jgi:hypothetical protein